MLKNLLLKLANQYKGTPSWVLINVHLRTKICSSTEGRLYWNNILLFSKVSNKKLPSKMLTYKDLFLSNEDEKDIKKILKSY